MLPDSIPSRRCPKCRAVLPRSAFDLAPAGHVYSYCRRCRAESPRIQPQPDPNPSGLCMCGCGERTRIATDTDRPRGKVAGKPKRFVNGHNSRLPRKAAGMRDPNPSGVCLCGCGQPVPISKVTVLTTGIVKGGHVRYARGHDSRTRPPTYRVDPQTGCWIWLGTRNRGGYGIAHKTGRSNRLAHRVMYERLRGPIPKGLEAHHRCGVRPCVNPDHIEWLTPREHGRRHGRRPRAAA